MGCYILVGNGPHFNLVFAHRDVITFQAGVVRRINLSGMVLVSTLGSRISLSCGDDDCFPGNARVVHTTIDCTSGNVRVRKVVEQIFSGTWGFYLDVWCIDIDDRSSQWSCRGFHLSLTPNFICKHHHPAVQNDIALSLVRDPAAIAGQMSARIRVCPVGTRPLQLLWIWAALMCPLLLVLDTRYHTPSEPHNGSATNGGDRSSERSLMKS